MQAISLDTQAIDRRRDAQRIAGLRDVERSGFDENETDRLLDAPFVSLAAVSWSSPASV